MTRDLSGDESRRSESRSGGFLQKTEDRRIDERQSVDGISTRLEVRKLCVFESRRRRVAGHDSAVQLGWAAWSGAG